MENYANLLSGLPKYGARVLVSASSLTKVFSVSNLQIYVDGNCYYFEHPEDKRVYINVGSVITCDRQTVAENCIKAMAALGYSTFQKSLVQELGL